MIARFSLYGFLKNQKYYEPFIILFFLDQGLSFAQIGLLIGFRELCIYLGEVPSGALADLYGRRRCMMLSFAAYITSFILFGLFHLYWCFFIAMFFFAIGEAFRTGTHKSMIFTWLRIQGRTDEKTKVYGYTRSWSQLGSAFSIIVATIIVLVGNSHAALFLVAIVPYVIGLINFAFYPTELEGQPCEQVTLKTVLSHLWETLHDSIKHKPLRHLILESMAFEGFFKAAKDYFQPLIKSAALLLPIFMFIEESDRIAIMVGVIYFALHFSSAYASRQSHRVTEDMGGEEKGSRFLWKVAFAMYLVLIPMLVFELYYVAILTFVGLFIIQNFWKPILISRFDAFASETRGATVLSIESLARTIATGITAPLLGLAVDSLRTHNVGGEFWPVGAAGAIIALLVLITIARHRNQHTT